MEHVFEAWEETRSIGGIKVTFRSRQVLDEDGWYALDYLGAFTGEADEYTIHRHRDRHTSDYKFYLWSIDEPEPPNEDDYNSSLEYESAEEQYEDAMAEWEDNPYFIEWIDGRSAWERNSYDYFKPAMWHEVEAARKSGDAEALKQAIGYCVQDWQRAEEYLFNYWWMTGIITEMWIEDELVGEESLWGIESDSGTDYFESIIKEHISELIWQYKKNAEEKIETMEEALASMRSVFAALKEAA